ncbi:hypothetical protein [Williamsia soli]|uniref:hypothetical protein n=1 Tax=Williamsia soli TaxID=364929 RepID=UPI001A9EC689|nr:hypothetical protein [Williamsia soli]
MKRFGVMRVATAAVVGALVLGACGDRSEPPESAGASSSDLAPTPSAAPNAKVASSECGREPPSAAIDHGLQDFAFGKGSATVLVSGAAGHADCYSFGRWGNADPAVPLDSLLFLFKGPAADGVTIDMLVGDLTVATRVNARVAVALDDNTFQGDSCSMTITALSAEGVAGKFICPTATRVFGNPFAPLDDAEPEPSQSAPLPTVALSGWFTVSR